MSRIVSEARELDEVDMRYVIDKLQAVLMEKERVNAAPFPTPRAAGVES